MISNVDSSVIKKLLSSKMFLSGVAFQLAWFLLILAPPFVAFVGLLAYLLFHFMWISKDRLLWLFSIRIFVIGLAIDSFFFYSGIFNLLSGSRVIPLWLAGLWLCFCLAVPFGFSFLKRHYVLCALFGFVGAPISYFSGITLRDDVSLASPTVLSLVYVGMSWAIYLCYSFFLLKKIPTFSNRPLS